MMPHSLIRPVIFKHELDICPYMLQDFGLLTNKDHLPVHTVIFSETGGGSAGAYYVSWLQCAQEQFGKFSKTSTLTKSTVLMVMAKWSLMLSFKVIIFNHKFIYVIYPLLHFYPSANGSSSYSSFNSQLHEYFRHRLTWGL